MTKYPPTMHNPLNDLMYHIQHFPLWMKQVVYTEMKADLEAALSKPTLDSFNREECLQLMVPRLAMRGSQELHQPSGKYPKPVYAMLPLLQQSINVAGICVALQWTLEQACMVLLKAYQGELLVPCNVPKVEATIRYLGNQTRLGEYLVQIEKLTWAQLEQALATQQYIQDVLGEKSGLGDVLINLGFVTKQDVESILFLKEESKKAFIVNQGMPIFMGQTSVTTAAGPSCDPMSQPLPQEHTIEPPPPHAASPRSYQGTLGGEEPSPMPIRPTVGQPGQQPMPAVMPGLRLPPPPTGLVSGQASTPIATKTAAESSTAKGGGGFLNRFIK